MNKDEKETLLRRTAPSRQKQAQEYLHVQEAAAGFAAFYELYRRFSASLPLEALLRGVFPELTVFRSQNHRDETHFL